MNALPVTVGGREWRSSEAVYQACRFPDHPEMQEEIRSKASPMTAKMVAKKYRKAHTRPDWETVQLPVMEFVLRLKMVNWDNWRKIYWKLRETAEQNLSIVEISAKKDQYWGTKPLPTKKKPTMLEGENHLGLLWMKIRDEIMGAVEKDVKKLWENHYCTVPHPGIENLRFFGEDYRPGY